MLTGLQEALHNSETSLPTFQLVNYSENASISSVFLNARTFPGNRASWQCMEQENTTSLPGKASDNLSRY